MKRKSQPQQGLLLEYSSLRDKQGKCGDELHMFKEQMEGKSGQSALCAGRMTRTEVREVDRCEVR